ncbi:MAG: radical SAM family heme chaperone HemW [Chloroflexota bacterium]|nr:radical SAM family heme chaperone HemW [Chloroflexota bacterium]
MADAARKTAIRAPSRSGLALYVHIPFCESKCPYCDFNTYAGIEALMPSYVGALANEIAGWGKALERPPLRSVFFGGGTPSYLPTRDLTRLMRAVRAAFDLPRSAEVTLEANPGDTVRERLASIRRAGFNRVSIGVQSLDDEELRLLGRRHSAEQAKAGVMAAREAGFDNLNIDLIFGLPGQLVASWEHTLEEALALAPDHVSAYALTLEEGTPMAADVAAGRLREPDPDVGAEMYRLAQEVLADAGYVQYEVSNWAKPGRASVHNLAYWQGKPYLGVGPGAHSYLWANGLPPLQEMGDAGARFATLRSPRAYVEAAAGWSPDGGGAAGAVAASPLVSEREALNCAAAMGDYLMMALRLNEGVADADFAARFGEPIETRFGGALAECAALGLLAREDGRTLLTERGRLLGNEVFERVVAVAKER